MVQAQVPALLQVAALGVVLVAPPAVLGLVRVVLPRERVQRVRVLPQRVLQPPPLPRLAWWQLVLLRWLLWLLRWLRKQIPFTKIPRRSLEPVRIPPSSSRAALVLPTADIFFEIKRPFRGVFLCLNPATPQRVQFFSA